MENYSNNSSDLDDQSYHESDSNSDVNSLNSERLEQEFQNIIETQSENNDVLTQRSTNSEGKATNYNIETQVAVSQGSNPAKDQSLSEAQVAFLDRRQKFDKEFEKTLGNFNMNIDFLSM